MHVESEETPDDNGVVRELVVANQTVGAGELHDQLFARAAQERLSLFLLVPATPIGEQEASLAQVESLGGRTGEDPGYALARFRLERALRTLQQRGLDVDGAVGEPDPVRAVRSHLTDHEVDRILVSTLPARRSRWRRRHLARDLERETGLPVEQVTVRPG
jgi:hypothetical protein